MNTDIIVAKCLKKKIICSDISFVRKLSISGNHHISQALDSIHEITLLSFTPVSDNDKLKLLPLSKSKT